MDDHKHNAEEPENSVPSIGEDQAGGEFDYSTDVEDEGTEFEEQAAPKKRSADARISQLVAKTKELERRIAEKDDAPEYDPRSYVPPEAPMPAATSPEVQKAVELLKSQGFVTKDVLEQEVGRVKDQYALDSEHGKMESRYDGEDGKPSYDRTRVEKYMRDTGVYNPEAAYKLLHESELLDWEMKKAQKSQRSQPSIERSGTSEGTRVNSRTITPEKISQAASTPEGRRWYERNRGKILDMLQRGQLES